MRIRRVKIQSFGSAQGESRTFGPKLNVIYGPNEAGKSTLRSFITTTLFPETKLKYPAPKKSDSGTVEVELSDGTVRTYTRDGKGSDSDASDLCKIDDKEYISIYSMSPEDLRDMRSIEKGDIRNRFLTIPGGTDLPKANENLNKERFELLPEKKRSSKCITATLIEAENNAKQDVENLRNRETGDSQYAELVSRRESLDREIEAQNILVREKDRIRTESHKADALAANKKKIEELEASEKELVYSENVDDKMLPNLENEVKSYRTIAKKAHENAELKKADLDGIDHKVILNRKKEIRYIDRESVKYEQDIQEMIAQQQPKPRPAPEPKPQPVPEPVPEPTPVPDKKQKGIPVLAVVGIVGVVLGIALATFANIIVGAVIGVAGAALTVYGFMKNRTAAEPVSEPVPEPEPVPESIPEPEPEPEPEEPPVPKKTLLVEYVDNTLDAIMKETGMKSEGFHSDLRRLTDLVSAAEKYEDSLTAAETADKDLDTANDKMNAFLEGFGGREKYEKALKDKVKLGEVRASLKDLRESTGEAPAVDVDSETAESDYQDAVNRLNDLKEERGSVDQAVRGILEDTQVEKAITKWKDAESAAYEAALKWAGLTLERILLDTASDVASKNHRPDVMQKADLYLGSMTNGRYRMNTDPHVTDIAVIDTQTGDSKTDPEWSSGLGDQVKLALKLAVSLSLSRERPPVILDDILLTSDSERKKGACEAISSLSDDIQVLFFTCDKETRDCMESVGAEIIDL